MSLGGIAVAIGAMVDAGIVMLDNIHRRLCQQALAAIPAQTIISRAEAQRIRPMLMTSLTLLLSFIPILSSDGTGADVMKRIAAAMVGRVLTALVMILIVYPVIFSYWKDWKEKKQT